MLISWLVGAAVVGTLAPLVVGLILGPMFEAQLRRALSISQGDPATLVQSTFAVVIYVSLLVLVGWSTWLKSRERRLEEAMAAEQAPEPAEQHAGQSTKEQP